MKTVKKLGSMKGVDFFATVSFSGRTCSLDGV
jgi:hypothetical protein